MKEWKPAGETPENIEYVSWQEGIFATELLTKEESSVLT